MALAPGDRFDRYEILALLGRGGMGEVYLALDPRLNRKVALKLLPAEFTRDDDRVRRLDQEARAASALNHPNIITIYETGQSDGVHFLATEFIEGETLRARMAFAQLSTREALEIAIQVASALTAAHEADVIHRDVKPENVMLRPDGLVKVLDFGLAKLTGTDDAGSDPNAATETIAGRTEPHVVMGTIRYMSPEQARGLVVDTRTDIFSVGIVLYEMLAGVSPFEGQTKNDVLAAIMLKEPAPLSQHVAGAPPALEQLVAKALTKDRDARYQTAKDLLIDLKRLRDAPGAAPRATTKRRLALVSASLVAAAGVVVALLLGVPFLSSGPEINSVAVLPFANVGATPDTEWLSDGITETLIRDLSRVSRLSVRPRYTVFRYKGREVDPVAVGRELDVHAVLTGRLERRGDSIAITVDLIEVPANRQIWGDRYDYQLGELLLAQDEISREVTDRLRLRLAPADAQVLARRSTTDAEAHQLYLKGRFHWNQLSEPALKQAIAYFHEALKRDPNYALPYVGLADSYIYLGADLLAPKDAFPQAKAYALEALRLDDALPDAHAALGIVKLVYEWDWAGARRELLPNLNAGQTVEAFSCALHYADALGRNEEAIAMIQRSLDRDPLSLIAGQELACASYYGRHYDQVIKRTEKILAASPEHVGAYFLMGRAYGQRRQHTESIAALSKARALSNDWPVVLADLGYTYARSGRRAEALQIVRALTKQASRRYVDGYLFATLYVGLGDADQTFKWLEQAYDARSGYLPWLRVEPKWDAVRSDSRFADLLRRVGLSS